jgi:hypothetical protein
MKTNRRNFIKKALLGTTGLAFSLYLGNNYFNSFVASKIDIADLQELIISIAGTIIPTDETPGAAESNIYEYIKYLSDNVLTTSEKSKLITGLLEIINIADNQFGKPFQNCSSEEKLTILCNLQSSSIKNKIIKKIKHKIFGKSFIEIMKSLTIECYATSEEGCKKFFQYDFIPVNYQSSIDIDNTHPAWATK